MTVEVSVSGPRADITLRRPEVLNAMDWTVFEGLAHAAAEVAAAPDVRVTVVQGEGRSFSSGIDTSTFGATQGDPEQMIARAQAGFRAIAGLPMPTIASVRGHALGAGLQLALACDLRVVARGTSLGILESRYGLVPDLGGTQRLPQLVGPARAKKMIWLAEKIEAEEAVRIGLVEMLVDIEELDASVDDLAARIAAAPPLAVRETKRLVDLASQVPLEAGMDEEANAQMKMFASADFVEAITAFMEKRVARYEGR